MKPKYGALCIGLILAAVATILLIALPGSANLYAAYVFCLIGIAMMVAGVWVASDNSPSSFALLGQVAWFLPISLIISVIVLVLQGANVFVVPVVWHSIMQIIVLAFAGIRIISVYIGKQEIETIDKQVSAQRNRFSAMQNTASALLARIDMCPEEQRSKAAKSLKQLIDTLRYSDPISSRAVQALDEEIEQGISDLSQSFSADNIERFVTECNGLCSLIRERNNILKNSK